jgi:hypothetical protein
MTTTVRILIEGNKNVLAKVVEADGVTVREEKEIAPNSFASFLIHGEAKVSVEEIGEFVN